MTAYKLLRVRKDGSLGPLFINARQRVPLGVWLPAEPHRRKGYAFRPGWHCTLKPVAPHLTTKGRTWCRVDIEDYLCYSRPESQGGTWALAQRMKVNEVLNGDQVLAVQITEISGTPCPVGGENREG